MKYYLVNRNGRYFATVDKSKAPSVPFTKVAPPQAAIDALQGSSPPTMSAEWNGHTWLMCDNAPMQGYKSPVETRRRVLTRREFFSSRTGLTGAEQESIRAYADDKRNANWSEVYELVQQIDSSDTIDLDLPEVVEGMQLLVDLSLISTSDRRDNILKGVKR